jgi:hypothetical protein
VSWKSRTVACARIVGALSLASPNVDAQSARAAWTREPVRALVRVEHPGPAVVSLAPGERITTLFRVVNESNVAQTLRGRVEHPAAWRLITPEAPFVVAAGATELRLLSVAAPLWTAPGRYWLVYEVSPAMGGMARDSVGLTIVSRPAVVLGAVDVAPIAAANRPYRATFVARNTGNVLLVLRSRVVGTLTSLARVDTSLLSLDPGDSRVVSVDVTPREGAQLRGSNYLGLQIMDVADSSISGSAGSVVDFVAHGSSAGPPGRELSSTIALRYSPNTKESERAAVDLVSEGPISGDSATSLQLLVRTPGPRSSPLFDQDEYRLTLQSPHWTLRAGDQFLQQSPLTEAGRLTFGVATSFTAARLSAAVFDLSSRWRYVDGRSQGASLGLRLGDSALVRVNGLAHRGGNDDGRVVSLGASAAPFDGANVGVELGRGWPTTQASVDGIAWRAQVLRRAWQIGSNGYATGTAYPARNGYGDHLDAFASGELSPAFRVRANLDRRAFARTVGGVSYALDTDVRTLGIQLGSRLGLEWREQDLMSRLDSASVDEAERGARLLLNGSVRPVELSGVLEGGTVDIHPQGLTRKFARASARSGVRGAWSSFSLFADYTNRSAPGTTSQRWLSTGVVAGADVGATHLSATALSARDGTFARVRFTMLDARLDHFIGRTHRLGLRWRSLSFGPYTAGRETHVVIEYGTSFGIPVGRDRSTGRLMAAVVDRETGRGVSDAIVRIAGERFMTDAAGRLVLDGMIPGTYPVSVDRAVAAVRSSGGPAAADGPSSITIRRAATERVELGLARGARVVGRVSVVAPRDSAKQGFAGDTTGTGVPIVLVTAAGVRDTVLQLTDADGGFSFVGLSAGRWTISVSQADAPANHRYQPASKVVDIGPGQTSRLTIIAVPVQRGIRWREGGALIEKPRGEPQAR